jgi:hypothetical protein
MCNDTIIVLSDAASTKELLDVRGASSSDRPKSHAIDLITNGLYLSTVGYGQYFSFVEQCDTDKTKDRMFSELGGRRCCH